MEITKDEEYLINDSTIGVTNYLVSLYERTENLYLYYPTKINRLLTIYKLCTLKYNDKCLDSDFIITDDRTMGIVNWLHYPFFNIFSMIPENCSVITDKLEILDNDKIYLPLSTKEIYQLLKIDYKKEIYISEDSKKLLEIIFRKFGNFPYDELNTQLNQIVSNVPLRKTQEKNYIKLEDFTIFINDNKKFLKHNAIFEFIKDFDRKKIDISYDSVLNNLNCLKKIKSNK